MDATRRFRLLQASMFFLIMILVISGMIAGIFSLDKWTRTEENIAMWNFIKIFAPVAWIVTVPLLTVAIIKYRKSELTNPTGFTQLYFRRRDAKQCTICQKHPVSKKYHIKNEHNLKNVKIDDYFRDCGCAKCAIYNKSDFG